MQRMADLRTTITTIEEADEVFREYAIVCKRLAAADAKHELRVANLAANHVERTAPDRKTAEDLKAHLSGFVDNNRDLFVRPRKRKTEQGTYGLQTVTELVIADRDALVDALMDRGYDDCMEVVRKPIKPAIRERLKAGETFPGCTLRTGDTAVCKVAKALLDEARQEAQRG